MPTTTATITAIGDNALSTTDPMVILFDASATTALRDVAVIQAFTSPTAQSQLTLQAGDQLVIDQSTFTISKVGALANDNLRSIGHVTLLFAGEEPTPDLANAIVLDGPKPTITVGSQLSYQTLG